MAKVIGLIELRKDLEDVQKIVENPIIVTKELDRLMTKFAPVRTGHLKSTIYHKGNVAGAKAPHAGWVELMGERIGKYDYAMRAIEAWDLGEYGDEVMGPL